MSHLLRTNGGRTAVVAVLLAGLLAAPPVAAQNPTWSPRGTRVR